MERSGATTADRRGFGTGAKAHGQLGSPGIVRSVLGVPNSTATAPHLPLGTNILAVVAQSDRSEHYAPMRWRLA
jgi:hypothetical protein